MRNVNLSCLAVYFLSTSAIVMKFFNDLDILQPAIVKWPECKK